MSKTLYQVFKNLAWPDLCQAALVCKAWREVRVVFVQRHRLAQLLSWSPVFPLLYFFLFRQQKIPLYGRTFPSWRGWPWLTSLVSSGQAGQSYGYSHVFFSLLPLISISKFYSPVHTSGVLRLRDSRWTCRAATSQTVSSTLASLGLFCKRS